MSHVEPAEQTAQPTEDLSFQNLVRPGLLLLGLAALAIIGLIALASVAQNVLTRNLSRETAANILKDESRNLSGLVKDYAWWGETVDYMVVTRNSDWIAENLGHYIREQQNVSDGFLVAPDGHIAHRINDDTVDDLVNVKNNPDLARLWQQSLANGVSYKPPVTGYVGLNRQPYLAAGTVVLDTKWLDKQGQALADAPIPPAGQRWVLIFLRDLNGPHLIDRATAFGLSEAHLDFGSHSEGEGRDRVYGSVHLPMVSFSGRLVGNLGWQPQRPGDQLLGILAPLVIAVLFGIALLARMILKRWLKMAERLAERESRLNVLLNSIGEGLLILSEDGVVQQANPMAGRLLGYTSDNLVGRQIATLFAAQDGDFLRQILDLARQQPAGRLVPAQREMVARRADGTLFPIDTGLAEVPLTSSRLYAVILHDIGERKQAETAILNAKAEVERISNAKDELLDVVSHEMRTPINAIFSFLELIEDGPLSERQKTAATHIRQACQMISRLLRDMVEASGRNQFMPAVLDLAPIEPGRLVHDVVRMSRPEADARRQTINVEIAPDLPALVICDHVRITQVLGNFINNALKFSPMGDAITVHLSKLGESADQVALRFSIRDNGPGIAPIYHQRIFERFFQISPDGVARPGGVGLGLAIANAVSESMGGRIILDSAPGAGTQIHLELTLSKAATSQAD